MGKILTPRERLKWAKEKAEQIESLLKARLPPEDFEKIGIEPHWRKVLIYIIEFLPKDSYEKFLEVMNLEKARWDPVWRSWEIRTPLRVSQPLVEGREVKPS